MNGTQPTSTHQAARASWMAPVIAVVFVAFSRNIPDRTPVASLIIGGVAYLMYLAGLAAAIYALITMRRVGKPGVLVPALIGLVISGGLVAIFTLSILRKFPMGTGTHAVDAGPIHGTERHGPRSSGSDPWNGATWSEVT